jgi:hypothetical protein
MRYGNQQTHSFMVQTDFAHEINSITRDIFGRARFLKLLVLWVGRAYHQRLANAKSAAPSPLLMR